jgi:hypothetical protein
MIDPLAFTIKRANEIFEAELEQTEAALIDAGATGEQIIDAIGRDGYWRQKLEASRAEQIAAVKQWVSQRGYAIGCARTGPPSSTS